MTFKFHKTRPVVTGVVASFAMLPAIHAHAGGTITFGEDKSVSIGFGMRTSYSSIENGAPNGTSRSNDFKEPLNKPSKIGATNSS